MILAVVNKKKKKEADAQPIESPRRPSPLDILLDRLQNYKYVYRCIPQQPIKKLYTNDSKPHITLFTHLQV